MKVGFSFCPNDTFLFYAWVHGLVGGPITPHIADVEELNQLAFQQTLPVTKLSFTALFALKSHYTRLPIGSALGWNSGPKIIAKKPFSLDQLPLKTIAIPGRHTTANLLLDRLLPPPFAKQFCRYDQVADLINNGTADCGLIIHESRFTFLQDGFLEIIDLGELWHQKTDLPLPLGCIAVRSDIDPEPITKSLRDSLLFAKSHLPQLMPYIQKHSLIKDETIIKAHINLYVNEESLCLSPKGEEAIHYLAN